MGPAASWLLKLEPIPPIPGQAEPLREMFRQFFRNAVDALPEGKGTITISTQTAPSHWSVVEIRDNGCGMTPEVMEHALEPFYTTKPDHLGIGLAIARGIWRRHRGTMSVESQPGEGTTVRLSVAGLVGKLRAERTADSITSRTIR